MSDPTAQQVMDLFVHRRDVFARQQTSGAYFPEKRPIELEDIDEHLAGLSSIGTYVIEPKDQTVSFIVFDLDTHDKTYTDCLVSAVSGMVLAAAGGDVEALRSLIRESSGNKGTHVWLFLSRPILAARARAWVARDFLPAWEEVGEPLEIFPKQDVVEEGGYGNLVKLPFGVHAVSRKKSELIVTQGWADSVVDVVRFPSELVPEWDAPVRTVLSSVGSGAGHDGAVTAPFPCIASILNDGVGDGNRDNAMYHLARYAASHGLPEDLTLEWCVRVNDELFDPPLPEREVRVKVRSAVRARKGSSCNAAWLRDFCPGGPTCKWSASLDATASKHSATRSGKSYLAMNAAERREWRRQQRGS